MRLTAPGALLAAILLIPGLAVAQSQSGPREGSYLELRGGGATDAQISAARNFVFEAALGQAYANNLRVEIALGHYSQDIAIGVVNLSGGAYTAMLNGYYDFDYGGLFTPFIGFGAGGALFDMDVSSSGVPLFSDSDLVYAYRGVAGISYDSSSGLSFNLTYSYFRTGDPNFASGGVSFQTEVRSHVVMLGVRIALDDLLTCCRGR